MSNPFQQSMVRLLVPDNMGKQVSARGFTLDADSDGCVEVPKDVADELQGHGCVAVARDFKREAPARK